MLDPEETTMNPTATTFVVGAGLAASVALGPSAQTLVDNELTRSVAAGAAVGTFLGATAGVILRRDEQTIQRWAIRGSVVGGSLGLGSGLAVLGAG